MPSPNGPVKKRPPGSKPSTSGTTRSTIRWLPRHDVFAEALVNGRTIKDAYTLAGGNPNGGGTPQKWLAWPLMKERIARLRAERMDRLALDKDQVILNLVATYNAAMRADQYMAATRAMDQVAKLLDLYPSEKRELDVHLIAKPALEPTKQIELSVEDWRGQFSPKEVQQ